MRNRLSFTLGTLLAFASLVSFGARAFAVEPCEQMERNGLGVAVGASDAQIRTWFQEAPSILPEATIPLKGQPLWHTNGELSDEIIHEIFEEGQKNGFGGITFLPLTRTTPKYLTDEYLTQYGKALDLAAKLNMKVVYYDDLDFPSGSAGWRLREKFPESTLKRLDKVEWNVQGPVEFSEKSPIPLGDKAVFGKPEGVLQAAVALNTKTNERVNLRERVDSEGVVAWSVPEGEWKIMLFLCVSDPKGIVDYMSPSAVKNFFSLTYDVFYEKFKPSFGTTITAIFFDDITNGQTNGWRNWALEFNDKYRELFGKDPDLDYPALFYPLGDDTPAARYRLWTTRNRLFADGYPGMVRQWRVDHNVNVVATGHPQGPYVIQPIDMCGDAMATQKGSDAVLFDSIHYYGHGRDGFKLPTSAAFNYDFPLCFVEIYGNYRNNTFDKKMMMRSAMEIFARGANVFLPHGTWTDPATVYIPPEISWRNPKLEGFLPSYGEYVSRTTLLLRGGRHVSDVGILYPIDNLKAFFHFSNNFITGDYPHGVLLPRETDYLAVGSQFTTRIWNDFTFVHPETLDAKTTIVKRDGETLLRLDNKLNWEEYRVFVVPGADVISLKNLEKIAEFYDQGGKLLATTRLPSMASEGPEYNAKVREIVQRIFGVDPLTQEKRDAIATGQEDIVLPENFVKARELNKDGEYDQPLADSLVAYEDSVYRDRAVFVPRPTTENLRAARDYLLPRPDVLVEPVEGEKIPTLEVTPRWDYAEDGMFQYIHKVKNGLDVYYFANSSNSPAKFYATLRGQFDSLETWNPVTGEMKPLTSTDVDGAAKVRLDLEPIESIFVVGKRK